MHGVEPVSKSVKRKPTEPVSDPVQPVDQMRTVRRFSEDAAPLARVRERADERQRRATVAVPVTGWVRQVDPVPPRLLTGRMVDDGDRPTSRGMTRLTRRPQPAGRQARVNDGQAPS